MSINSNDWLELCRRAFNLSRTKVKLADKLTDFEGREDRIKIETNECYYELGPDKKSSIRIL